MHPALESFHPVIRRYFGARFEAPTPVQAQSWPLITQGDHVLATAPTGSGKTLTAFLSALNDFATGRWAPGATRVLYVSPLKALNTDIRENLLEPLAALKAGGGFPAVRAETRSGDTSATDRQRLLRQPPEILITTPESLALMLTSRGGQGALSTVETVIVDEIHALVDNRRGVALMTSLERLAALAGEFQRLALSATVEPLDTIAAYIGGFDEHGQPRPVRTVRAAASKSIDFRIRFPHAARSAAERGEPIWESLVADFRTRVRDNEATLFFTNSRRLAEKITLKINEGEPAPLAYAHHGSLAREIRTAVEDRLRMGSLKAIVATSSLEMGIDVGHLDEVVLIQSPPTIATTVQRIGRAGHRVGEVSRGTLYPTHARDFLEAAVLAEALPEGDIEPLTPLAGCLDVLAQVIVSMTAQEAWPVDALFGLLRRSTPYRDLPRAHFDAVVEMLAGRYAGTRIRELKPRVDFDRTSGTVRALKSAVFAYYASGGTIPDRGYYTLRHADTGNAIGELDEEFVWEARVGQSFAFGTQNWRIQCITHNDVLVRPAGSGAQAPPFWRSETLHRSVHYSERIGTLLDQADTLLARKQPQALQDRLCHAGFEPGAAAELVDYLDRQRQASGARLPHGRHLVLEWVRAGPGGYRGPGDAAQLVIHTFWGGRVNLPWALALKAALSEHLGRTPEIHADDNAIAIGLGEPLDPDLLLGLVRTDNCQSLLRRALESSGFFGARFRECAGRSLLLSRARFNERLPLWLSRLQAKKLMTAVRDYTDFPVLLETWRTCLADEFDLPALSARLDGIADGRITWEQVECASPSPFAAGLTWNQISRYMYADDTPELQGPTSLSDELIRDVLVNADLRPRLDPALVEQFEAKLRRCEPAYQPQDVGDFQVWIKDRILVPATELDALDVRTLDPQGALIPVNHDGRRWFAHRELIGDLVGSGLVPASAVDRNLVPDGEPRDPLSLAREILAFYGPRTRSQIETLLPRIPEGLLTPADDWISGPLVAGSDTVYWCDATTYESLLRFQRAAARPEIRIRPAARLPATLARWQGFGRVPSDDALLDALLALRGYSAPVRVWLRDLLPARLPGVTDGDIDRVMQNAGLVWFGTATERMAIGYPEDQALLTEPDTATGPDADIVRAFADPNARYSFEQLVDNLGEPRALVARKLWEAVWTGRVHADSLAPLRQGIERGFELPSASAAATARRPRRGALRVLGQGFAGNWQLTRRPESEDDPLLDLESGKERARLLIDRYGVLCRELANREGGRLRWAALFRVLAMMELAGELVSGYFFDGLSGPQFASPAMVARLGREEPATSFWASTYDPVAPAGLGGGIDTGFASANGEGPSRRLDTYVSYLDDEPAAVIEGGGRRLRLLLAPDHPRLAEALAPLEHLLRRRHSLTIASINGEDARSSPYLPALSAMFKAVRDHKQIVLESR